MSITTTLARLFYAVDTKAMESLISVVPPGRYKFQVASLFNLVSQNAQECQKQQHALIAKYGVLDEKTNMCDVSKASQENQEAFTRAITELFNTEVTLDCNPILWSKLGEDADKKLSVKDVINLGPLLIDDEEGTK